MSLKLENKVAVITGGNSGIGLATAKLFKDQGATVIITASSDESFNVAKTEYGDQFDIVKTNVAKISELESFANYVEQKYSKIDVLFLNAGIAHFAPLEAITEDFFDNHFNVNVKGTLFAVQKFSNLLNEGASVFFTTSGVSTKGMPGASVYGATKAALRLISKTLSAELVGRKIRVNTLSPGPVETPIFGKMGLPQDQLDEMAKGITASTPIGRFAKPEEMAKAALFLASDDSSYLLGSEIVADGGFSQL